ncbi:hypothetical protein EVAR_20297_1 [Eumeta japonica]|uniref:Uncharacterized protein n=1 Tax=Eumeta variegata TaxID=151549 RepID=A0A4C1VQN9_EUMVA|nr:hypothetical protein EVAR_20297_1 [Eumeta japonica]
MDVLTFNYNARNSAVVTSPPKTEEVSGSIVPAYCLIRIQFRAIEFRVSYMCICVTRVQSRGKQQVSHQKADGYLRPWRCQIVTSALPASYEGMGYLMEDWADEGGEDYWNTYEIQHLITQKVLEL